jgi:hypothetical protein
MSPLFTYKGKLLQQNGKLANSPNCCCCKKPAEEWRIWEAGDSYGYPVPYPNGPIIESILVDIPCCWTPPYYEYNGYLKLQVRCKDSDPDNNNSWNTIDSWTTREGQPEKCFEESYPDPCCTGQFVYTTDCSSS